MSATRRLLTGWEVEWCPHVPKDAAGENDLDAADYRAEDFSNESDAIARAKELLPKDWFGSVRVTRFEMQPIVPGSSFLTREYVSGPNYVEDQS